MLIFEVIIIKKLVIDLQSNGGGSPCIAFGLMSYLVKDFNDIFPKYTYPFTLNERFWKNNSDLYSGHVSFARYDLIKSNLQRQLNGNFARPVYINGTRYDDFWFDVFFSPYELFHIDNGTQDITPSPWGNFDWYDKSEIYNRGGINAKYSQPFSFMCTDMYTYPPNTHGYFDVDDIMILSDGLCGSTCSNFIKAFAEYQKAKIVTFGGLLNKQMDSSSFSGGLVMKSSSFYDIIQTFNNYSKQYLNNTSFNFSLFPEPLITSAQYSTAYFEIYDYLQAQKPSEFIKVPAHYHLNSWLLSESPEMLENLYSQLITSYGDACLTCTLREQQQSASKSIFWPNITISGLLMVLFASTYILLRFCICKRQKKIISKFIVHDIEVK